MDARWKVTTITVPSGSGSVAYTPAGWAGKTPKALIFYGTNWLLEDAADTANGRGVFRGMCAPQWDSPGTLNQQAACAISTPSGNAHSTQNNAIRMLNTAGAAVVLYNANVTSLDSGGFTLNWLTGAAGGYKVIVVALFEVDNVAARLGAYSGVTINLGFKAEASLLHGAWAGPIDGTDRTQEFYGGAAYPGGNDANWDGVGGTVFCFPTSNSGQYVNELEGGMSPAIHVVTGGHFTGPFLITSNILAYPTGSPAAGNNFFIGGDSADGGMVAIWDDCPSAGFFQSPAQAAAATSTRSGLPFAPGLILGYTISNEPDGQGTGSRGAIGFGVATPDFQWCATVDGQGQGAFQSFQRAIADVVSGVNVHAASVDLTDDGFVLTTEEAAVTADSVVWHAFGHPTPEVVWVPEFNRRKVTA